MDLDAFLKWEKDIIREERERLSKLTENDLNAFDGIENVCPAAGISSENIRCNRNVIKNGESSNCTINAALAQVSDRSTSSSASSHKKETTPSTTTCIVPSQVVADRCNTKSPCEIEKNREVPVGPSNETFSFNTSCAAECESENATGDLDVGGGDLQMLSKTAKEVANQQTAFSINCMTLSDDKHVSNNVKTIVNEGKKAKKKDDMEQWVTDTFYSYFPAYNDELQKRQRYLRERQQENQQNLLKHRLAHPPLPRYALQKSKKFHEMEQTVNTARSSATTTSNTTNTSTTMSHPTNKTDLEIIVNNPGYVPPKQHSSRPNTTRHKLLQDLSHTELSQIVGGNAVTDRNRNSAELETARKKDYQRELMQQIEEKRRSVEVLREKERHQDEALTRRLQEQLKTIQLEEQLEKEKIRAEKVRFDTEQNRLLREQLLAKLENDNRLLNINANCNNRSNTARGSDLLTNKVENVPGTATTADVAATCDADNNKVYKYFSNSARHEYRRGKPLPEELELNLGIQTLKAVRDDDEFECFHLSEKVCPMCDAPLRSYESCCLRCQKKLSLRMKARYSKNNSNDKTSLQDDANDDDDASSKEGESYSMVCAKCERLYGLCATCVAQKDVCRACHRKRNVCLNCRRTLCSRCLDEIASGRDTERNHINDFEAAEKQPASKTDAESLHSFQVLEVNYGGIPERNNNAAADLVSPRRDVMNQSEVSQSDIIDSPQRLPYSINIEKNSIFHADYKPVRSFEPLDSTTSDEQFNIERVRKETDKRLSRYLMNYGDLAVSPRTRSKSECGNDRSTQTTPNTAGRRDVVIHEEHNLSMPLLREMPKMTRTESDRMVLKKPSHTISNRIQQLKRRWEVPAVQKFTISSTSPKVLTQVGAIRKQLQAENIMGDN